MPFEEFTSPTLEHLLSELSNAKIPGSKIEVSSSEDGHHYACSKPLVNILIYTSETISDTQEYKDLLALYQYCHDCKNAARVL